MSDIDTTQEQNEQIVENTIGTIETKKNQIVGLVMHLCDASPEAIEMIDSVMGVAFYDNGCDRVWKLKHSTSYIYDEWRFLYNGLSWQANQHGLDLDFIEASAIVDDKNAVENNPTPHTLDMYDPDSQAAILIRRYKTYLDTARDGTKVTVKKEVTGHQRLMNKTWALFEADDDLNPTDRLTLIAILKHCWSKDHCTEWVATLAKEVGCVERTLSRSLANLVKFRWISVTHRHRAKSTYRVLRKELIPPYPTKKTP